MLIKALQIIDDNSPILFQFNAESSWVELNIVEIETLTNDDRMFKLSYDARKQIKVGDEIVILS